MENKLRIAGIEKESIVDGPGLRLPIYLQGCEHDCPGCHNPESHDLIGGILMSVEEVMQAIEPKINLLLNGITFTGGEPFLQSEQLLVLVKEIIERKIFNNKGDIPIVIYTGYLFDDLIKDEKVLKLLEYTNLLIDGKFELDKRDTTLQFVGSGNQRIIDVVESLKNGKVCIWKDTCNS